MTIFARSALIGDAWFQDVRVEIREGEITSVTADSTAVDGDTGVQVLLPALSNLHSHTFQRAMAGMTEYRAAGRESFWTWRDLMYRFLDRLTPEQVEAIAAQVFLEMQEAGYAAVGEFHYVHHQPGGAPYDQLSELSQRIFAAAGASGIGLTHLPVLYSRGGVRDEVLAGGQLRFGNDTEQFLRLADEARGALAGLPADARLGIAPHSLRAVAPDGLEQVLAATPSGPVHIHISEQVQEVEDVQAVLGQRPVSWLLDNADVNARWCLIHATHMAAAETAAMARSGAVAGLCPITEANLGDGIFNGAAYLEEGGAFGVGSDSNVRIALGEELRSFEYSQRLRDKSRNILAAEGGSTGQRLYNGAARGGAQALDRNAGEIAPGRLADLVAIDRTAPALCALSDAQLLDGLCFAAGEGIVTDLWSAGRHMVRQGRHVARDAITPAYRKAVADLLAAI